MRKTREKWPFAIDRPGRTVITRPLSGVSAFVSEGAVRPAGKHNGTTQIVRSCTVSLGERLGCRARGTGQVGRERRQQVRRAKSLAWIGGVGLLGLTPAMGFAQGLPQPP